METKDIYQILSDDSGPSFKWWFFMFSFILLLGGGIMWEYFGFLGKKPSEIVYEFWLSIGETTPGETTPVTVSNKDDLIEKIREIITESNKSDEILEKMENILAQVSETQEKIAKLSKNSKIVSIEHDQEILALEDRLIEHLKIGISEIRQSVEKLPELQAAEVRKLFEESILSRLTKVEQMIKAITPINIVQQTEELFAMPACLLSLSPEIQDMLPMSPVNVQTKTIDKDIQQWMIDVTDPPIIKFPFFIMRREVTVGEFEQYYNELPPGQKDKFGKEWQEDAIDNDYPVVSIPWEAANDYAKWLSKKTEKTGCLLALPTRDQWRAAVIQYAKPEEANVRKKNEPKLQKRNKKLSNVVDLLGNLREWSKEKEGCPEHHHYTLGEDYKTSRDKIVGEPYCQLDELDTIGFRLIVQENSQGQHEQVVAVNYLK